MEAMIFLLLFVVLLIASMWVILEKANQPGWAILIPIYSAIVLLRVVERPAWHILLLMIPIVNFIVSILIAVEMAQHFGKGGGYAIGLILLPFVFYPMLAFGDAEWRSTQGYGSSSGRRLRDDRDEDWE